MALHRDIFWVGRQWAVTGYGIQAVDQKHKSHFDIEVGRLWEDGLAEALQADGWFNKEDFSKALFVARSRYPEPSGKSPPSEPFRETASAPIETPSPAELRKPVFQMFHMQVSGWPAKFVRPWHVRVRP